MVAHVDVVPGTGTVPGWVDRFVPPPLTRRRIVRTALAMVDQSGLRRLTMDRLAGHLAVTPAALRHHVRGRIELIELLVDHVDALVLQAAGPPAAGVDEVRHLLTTHRDVWAQHRPLIPALHAGVLTGPAGEELVDRLAAAVATTGAGPPAARVRAGLLLQYSLAALYGADDGVLRRQLAALG